MAYEILKKITDCEKEADGLVAKAKKDAESILSEAKKSAEEIIYHSKEKYNKQAKSLTDSVMTEVSDEISVICINAEKKIEALKKTAYEKHSDTLKLIVERILGDI